jgi:phosphoglycerate dehydrogenase-like enzyme
MKPAALLINTSRGPVVHEGDLAAALRDGAIAGAALDVREDEPPGDSPLHVLPNALLTPHIASWTEESLHRVISTVAADLDRILSGRPALNYVNFALPRRQAAAGLPE